MPDQAYTNTNAVANTIDTRAFNSLVDLLRFRGSTSSHTTTESTPFPGGSTKKAFTVVGQLGHEVDSWSWEMLLDRADKVRHVLLTKADLKAPHTQNANDGGGGPRVALVFRKSEMLDFLAAFFGCQMAGMTAVPINSIDQFEEMTYILAHAKAKLALTTEHNYRVLTRVQSERRGMKGQGQESVNRPESVTWWKTDTLAAAASDTGGRSGNGRKGGSKGDGNWSTDPTTYSSNNDNTLFSSTTTTTSSSSSSTQPSSLTSTAPSTTSSSPLIDDVTPLPEIAYIEYTKSHNGELKGVAISHRTILAQCRDISDSLESNPKRQQRHKLHLATAASSEDISMLQSPQSPMPSVLTPSSHQRQEPADVVLSWLEPRQQVGLILGGLLGVYRGSHTVFLHSGVTETAGLWEQCAHRYGATLALGDYQGVRELIQDCSSISRVAPASLSSSPSSTSRENEPSHLKQLEAFLIDTVMVRPQLDADLATRVLGPLGVPSAEQIVVPMCSLPEHGGMILSMRDYLPFPAGTDKLGFEFHFDQSQEGQQRKHLRRHSSNAETRCFYLLSREALKTGWIEVLATGQDAVDKASEMGVILVSAFGYASPQATMVIVDPETTELCAPNRVGEIWIDSPSIPFGFWDLPKRSQSTFHALPLTVSTISSSTGEDEAGTVVSAVYDPVPAGFLRTGLMAGLIEGRVVVFGHTEDRIQQDIPVLDIAALEVKSYQVVQRSVVPQTLVTEHHYALDLVNTVLEKIVGFSACTAFECIVNKEHVPVICAETPRAHQRADAVRLADYIRQAMLDYHGLSLYCIAIAVPGSLPRALRHGKSRIHPIVCRKMLESGQLALTYLWTSTEDILLNLPVGDDVAGGIWGSDALDAREAIMPAHTRTIQYSSCDYPKEVHDERSKVDLSQFRSLADLLVWRSLMTPDEIAFQTLGSQQQNGDQFSFYPLQLQQQPQQQPAESSKDSIVGGVGRTRSWTFRKFGAKVVRIAAYVDKKGVFQQGDKVVLLFRTGSIDFIATLYAVWLLGLVPIPVPAPEPTRLFEDISLLMGLLSELGCSSSGTCLLGNSFTEEVMKLKTAQAQMKAYIGARQDTAVPTIFNISKAPKIPKRHCRNLGHESGYLTPPKSALLRTAPALIAVHYSTDRRRTLVKVNHAGLMAQTRTLKVQCQFQGGKPVVSCARSFVGLDILLACAIGVYIGAPTVLIPFVDFEARPQLYLEAVKSFNVRDMLVDCAMVELSFGSGHETLSPASMLSPYQYPSPLASPVHSSCPINLPSVHNFLVTSDSRPNLDTIRTLETQFCPLSSVAPSSISSSLYASSLTRSGNDLERTRLNGMFGHLVNPLITTRSSMDIEPVRLHISLNALRRGLVEVTTEHDDPTGIWIEDSGIPVCGTTVAIVNPETSEICLSLEIGEIWVSSEANVQPYIGRTSTSLSTSSVQGSDAMIEITKNKFNARIAPRPATDSGSGVSGYQQQQHQEKQQKQLGSKAYVRTGEIGFLWNYSIPEFNGGQSTSLLFVLGPIGETFEVQGLLHFPVDVEKTIEGAHSNFAPGGSIVFQAEEAVVCVVTVRQAESPSSNTLMSQALCVMHEVVHRHGFMPDVVAFVTEGVLAKTPFREKQRGKMLSLFMSTKMPLLYIHYSRGSLAVPNVPPIQDHQQQQKAQQLQHRRSTGDLLLSLNGTWSFTPVPAESAAVSAMTGFSSAFRHSSTYSYSESSQRSSATTTPLSSASSSISRCGGEDIIERLDDDRPLPGSPLKNRSRSTRLSSLRSVRTVQAFVGSIFHNGARSSPLPG
ncbi:acetyl-CoA synthetase-like protein [Linnemannia elongata AG-77]|uniref:Acetyl-CoA synthetase-like protein n=1 Tax=Linnemannia elongata AG-77 TaxID=1314771 RepID=A0A197JVR7_9FUNG|nr:acetyl-CoA synthetase-like protein [Linnemannia elongata AG-77]